MTRKPLFAKCFASRKSRLFESGGLVCDRTYVCETVIIFRLLLDALRIFSFLRYLILYSTLFLKELLIRVIKQKQIKSHMQLPCPGRRKTAFWTQLCLAQTRPLNQLKVEIVCDFSIFGKCLSPITFHKKCNLGWR